MKFDLLSNTDKAHYIRKASTLVEALPYIRRHAGKIIVIKYGGHAMVNKEINKSFSRDICLLKEVGINPIIVHGGGPQIGKMLKKKNIKNNFIEGLRVTDKKAIRIVENVLSKEINKKIVKDIKAAGGNAYGMPGNIDDLITAKKLYIKKLDTDSNIEKTLDLGFVGEPTKISVNKIKKIISKKMIPVIAPIGKDNNDNTYNINADTVAGAIAGAIKASKLLLLTDVAGIMDQNNKLISILSINEAKKIVNEKYIVGGMKPKISTCIKAIDKGVKEATILDGRISHSVVLELFTEHGIGTQIYS
tara:strand:+ start:4552 stop:5463 length:912 start_codon:yes stop_codon:yes gene_type:complete